jgi:glyceraldehyde 3-phosphate dehydrogenase
VAIKVGVNGFGRIGRQTMKAIWALGHQGDVEIVAVNDLTDVKTLTHLLKYDSNYGRWDAGIEAGDGCIKVHGKCVAVTAEKDPTKLDWAQFGCEIVLESTGLFTAADKAQVHLQGPVKKVIISAPAKGEAFTIVLGVNDDAYDPATHHIISNASCTTNCLAPFCKVLNDSFGVQNALMTTIHSYTNDQRILDLPHSDLRRARAAGLSMIPTTTGAAKAVGLVLPELKGKLTGYAMRVPLPTVSVCDLTVNLAKRCTAEDINGAMKAAAAGPMKGILEYCDEPLVSIDFRENPNSSIFDAGCTYVVDNESGGTLAKCLAWYDNEWGYSCRVADLFVFLAKKGL